MHLVNLNMSNQLITIRHSLKINFRLLRWLHSSSDFDVTVERVAKIIHELPISNQDLHHKLEYEIPINVLTTKFVENVLGRLFAAHSNGLKAYHFFKFSLVQPHYNPSSDAFEKTLHILARMRYFDKAWELMEQIKRSHPFLLTLKSMSIMLARIAKFQSYEETLESFVRMEKDIFSGKNFGTEGFNVVLRAFCTQRQMKEARSVFNKLHLHFPPNTKTMNILLLGFKESGDITAVELFYHEMLRRGFKPNSVTYNIRIDAYSKKGRLLDALRLLEEMERVNLSPTVETITTLIHGAGLAHNSAKAKELFNGLLLRNLKVDTGAYNALMSSLIRCGDVKSAAALMNEMEKKCIQFDTITYHTMFLGLIRSKSVSAVSELYQKMINGNFVPKAQTVVMLMKFFCENCKLDLGLNMWRYVVEKGHCPHTHALDILVTGLCSRGRVQEAFECSQKMLERGRRMSEQAHRTLERHLVQGGEINKSHELGKLMTNLQAILPPTRRAVSSC